MVVVVVVMVEGEGVLNVPANPGVSHRRTCSDNCTCCHTETEVADRACYLTQSGESQYTDKGPASPSPDPMTPGAWQGSHESTNCEVAGITRPAKKPHRESGIRTQTCRPGDGLGTATRPQGDPGGAREATPAQAAHSPPPGSSASPPQVPPRWPSG